MGAHRTPRGEASTAQGNGMKVPTDGYEGKHRKDDGVKGYKMGNPNRATEDKGGRHDRNS